MLSLGDKIREARQAKRLTQTELAKTIHAKNTAISNWENDIHKPDIGILERLCEALDVPPRYFFNAPDSIPCLTPAGQRIGRAYDQAATPIKKTVEVALEPYMDAPMPKAAENTVAFPVFDQPAAAGFGNYLDDATHEMVSLPHSRVPAGASFGVRITGDSMEPDIGDESIVLVEERLAIDSGQIGIFILNGDAYCKKLVIDHARNSRRVRLVSLNPKYEDIAIREADDLRTVGCVLGVVASHDVAVHPKNS